MATNLDALVRITAKVVGAQDVDRFRDRLREVGKAAEGTKKSFTGIVNSAAFQAAAVGAGAVQVALVLATKRAIELENAIVRIARVVGSADTPEGFNALRNSVQRLSNELNVSQIEMAALFEQAGQAGLTGKAIEQFAADAANVGLAFDVASEEAGRALLTIQTGLDLTRDEVMGVADAINVLAQTSGKVNAAELTEFLARTAASGRLIGLTGQELAAFGATMISAGINTEVAATSMRTLIRELSSGSAMTARQESAMRDLGFTFDSVEDKEKRLTRTMEQQKRQRLDSLKDETDQRMREISRRYRDETRALQDSQDDALERVTDAIEKRGEAEISAIRRSTEQRRKAIEAQFEGNQAILERELDALEAQSNAQLDAVRDRIDQQLKLERRAARDRNQVALDAINDRQAAEENAIQRSADAFRIEEEARLDKSLEEQKQKIKQAGSDIGRQLAQSLRIDPTGTIVDILNRLNNLPQAEQPSVLERLVGYQGAQGIATLATGADRLAEALRRAADEQTNHNSVLKEAERLSGSTANQIGAAVNELDNFQSSVGLAGATILAKLLPAIREVTGALGDFARNQPVLTGLIAGVAGLATGFILLLPFLSSAVFLFKSLNVSALAVLIPFAKIAIVVGGIAAAFLLAYKNLDFFRKYVDQALAGMSDAWQGFFDLVKAVFENDGDGIEAAWRRIMDGVGKATEAGFKLVTKLIMNALKSLPRLVWEGGKAIGAAIGEGISWALRGILNTVVKFIIDRVNGVIRSINAVVRAARAITRLNIPELAQVSVPRFAQGGFVDGKTLAVLGDNPSGREYAVPEEKVLAFANNIVSGRRGADAIPSSGGTGASSPGSVSVNVTTGPIMQTADGKQWLSVDDGRAMVQQAVTQLQRTMRTPGGRYYMGVR